MPRIVTVLAGVLIAAFAAMPAVFASESTVGPVTISVPDGFEGPQSQRQGGVQMAGWVKPIPGSSAKTLLQVTVVHAGAQLEDASPQELAGLAEKYLREFLSGIERRRTDYVLSSVDPMKLGGLPAARGTWKGRAGDETSVGVMYCVIVQKRFVVTFHTQDLGSTPTAAMREAMKSIEAVKLASGG